MVYMVYYGKIPFKSMIWGYFGGTRIFFRKPPFTDIEWDIPFNDNGYVDPI